MVKCSKLPRDPFLATSERMDDDWVLRGALHKAKGSIEFSPDELDNLKRVPASGPWEQTPIPIGNTRYANSRDIWVRGFLESFVLAIVGGLFLIVPLWVMVLLKTTIVTLITTSVLVAVFAFTMAFFLERRDVVSCTAAYAAVLVVFVGASTGKS